MKQLGIVGQSVKRRDGIGHVTGVINTGPADAQEPCVSVSFDSGVRVFIPVARAPKVLLTATPLQNSLLELFGLVSIIDEYAFGDLKSFKSQFSRLTGDDQFADLFAVHDQPHHRPSDAGGPDPRRRAGGGHLGAAADQQRAGTGQHREFAGPGPARDAPAWIVATIGVG